MNTKSEVKMDAEFPEKRKGRDTLPDDHQLRRESNTLTYNDNDRGGPLTQNGGNEVLPDYVRVLQEGGAAASMTDVAKALEFLKDVGKSNRDLLAENEGLPGCVKTLLDSNSTGTLDDIPQAIEYLRIYDRPQENLPSDNGNKPEYVQAFWANNPGESEEDVELAIGFMDRHDQGTALKSATLSVAVEYVKAMRVVTGGRGIPPDVTLQDLVEHFVGTYTVEDIHHVAKVFKERYGFIPCAALFEEHYLNMKVYVEQKNATLTREKEELARREEEVTLEKEELARVIESLKNENLKLKNQYTCKICLDQGVSIVYLPCAHLATCVQCDATWRQVSSTCPVCRCRVNDRIKYFV